MTDGPQFLTVPELADLLRIKERKVYDLAANGSVPCTRATGKLLFPRAEVQNWIAGKRTHAATTRPAVVLGSHDPLLEWAIRQSECGLATFLDGSADGVTRFADGEGIATGLHILTDDAWNTPHVRTHAKHTDAVLISWATRNRGLVSRPDQPVADITALARHTLAARQAQSGTARLLQSLLDQSGTKPAAESGPYHSEQDAVLAVAEGEADATLGLEAIAHQFNLSFAPILQEQFDLLVDRRAYFEAPFQKLLTFCRSDKFLKRAASMPGYDVATLGTVRWNA